MKKINLLLAMAFLGIPALSFAGGHIGFKCFDQVNNDEYKISIYLSPNEKGVNKLKSSQRGDIYPARIGQNPTISFERNNVLTITGGSLRDNVFLLDYIKGSQATIINNSKAVDRTIPCEPLTQFEAEEWRMF
ncbi:MAG: hypothetical protein J0M15_12755 [Deltaproteobacteria bacterium]|jgi:hypothetical protein|nr:hypothetical protein [Deltaproteobacteria bacterium]